MIELVKNPSTRVLLQGRLALWLAVSLVFAALLFAAGAQARGTNAPEGVAETSTGEAATESGAPPEEAASTAAAPSGAEEAAPAVPSATEEAPSVAEEASSAAPPATEEAPPAASPVAEEAPPATEEAAPASPPAIEEAAPPAPPATGEAAPPAPPVTGEAAPPAPPVTGEAPHVAEEAPTTIEKKTVEQTSGEVAAEAGSEVTQANGEDSQMLAGASGVAHKDDAVEVTPGVSLAVTTAIPPATASEISTTVRDQPSLALPPRTTPARCAGPVSCELAAIGASIRASHACGWLGISAFSSVSTGLASIDASPSSAAAIAAGAHSGSQDGGSSVENDPTAPLPGSGGTGGAGGGSAAAGGSGSASSAASTLVGVLLQAAPRAMRRMRLAQPSWRTSFFVLIPERPD